MYFSITILDKQDKKNIKTVIKKKNYIQHVRHKYIPLSHKKCISRKESETLLNFRFYDFNQI